MHSAATEAVTVATGDSGDVVLTLTAPATNVIETDDI
jgi:hypothetical protein